MTKVKKITEPARMNVKLVRVASAVNLICWPISAVGFLIGSEIMGLAFIVVALISAIMLMGTGVYRIVAGKPIDDMERTQRYRSGYYAFMIFGSLAMFAILIGFIGLDFAEDAFPKSQSMKSHDIMNFLIWATIDYLTVLPAAVLAWLMPTEEIGED